MLNTSDFVVNVDADRTKPSTSARHSYSKPSIDKGSFPGFNFETYIILRNFSFAFFFLINILALPCNPMLLYGDIDSNPSTAVTISKK